MIVYILCIVTVTWQGTPVTEPLLIFHDEISQTVNSNSLKCNHPTGPVAWYLAVRNTKLTTDVTVGTFLNVINNEGTQAQLRRGTIDRGEESAFDGLWTCRLNGASNATAFHVGIYEDNPPTSKITLQVDFPQIRGVFCINLLFELLLPSCSYCLNVTMGLTFNLSLLAQVVVFFVVVFVFLS